MKKPDTVAGYETAAQEELSAGLADYIQKRAGEGKSFAANLDAYKQYQLVPRVLRGIERVGMGVEVLGKKIAAPVMIAPTAWHKMFTPEGERATSEAAKAAGVPYVISSFSTMDFGEIGDDLSHAWYQSLMYKDLALMKRWIKKAEDAGVSAIVLTVDAPLGCSMCTTNIESSKAVAFPVHELPLFPKNPELPYNSLDDYYPLYMGSASSWDDIREIIAFTTLPVVLKGILHPADAEMAVEAGAKAIIVSNHGGRQLDDAIGTLDALALVPEEVFSKIDVYLDGGVRTGSDIFKALALGAKAVLIGRPILYGLAVAGQQGAEDILSILRKELEACMHLTGCARISDINKDLLF